MSLDRSLKSKSALVRSRSVLTRAERLAALKDEDRWVEGSSVFGLPKVRQRRATRPKGKAAAAQTDSSAPAAGEGDNASQPKGSTD